MTTRAGTVAVYLEATTADFTRGMDTASAAVKNFERVGGESGRAVTALERGFMGLAGEMTGIKGPLEQITKGLLLFGGGSVEVLGVAAAVTAVGLALEAMNGEANDAAKLLNDLVTAGEKLGRSPLQDLTLQKVTAQTQMREAQKRMDDLTAAHNRPFMPITDAEFTAGLKQAQLAFDNATEAANQFGIAINKALDPQIGPGMAAAMAVLNSYYKDMAGNFGMRGSIMGDIGVVGRAQQHLDALGGGGITAPLNMSSADMAHIGDVRNQMAAVAFNRAHAGDAKDAAAAASRVNALAGAINLLGSVAGLGATRVGQFISGLGGILGGVKGVDPLIGAALGVGGALINAIFGGKGDSIPVTVTNPVELKKGSTGPDKVSINILDSVTGASVRQINVDLRRQSRLDGIDRLPYGAQAA